MTQTQEILRYMKSRPIDAMTAMQVFRIMRLAARINDLRADGHAITTTIVKKNGKHWAQYEMAR